MARGVIFGDGVNSSLQGEHGQTAPILKPQHRPLLPTILSFIRGNRDQAQEFLGRRQADLEERLPRVVEIAKEIYRKRVNGMINPNDLSVHLLWGRAIENVERDSVGVLLVGRSDLDSFEIIPLTEGVFSPEEIYQSEAIIHNDRFYFIPPRRQD